eukprot:TRINITY_DN8883_c0_g1_i2.p1 TRINITY_DN8883_c0_g1~~TRINITY_DN8883_c0_g1_i2.p1  ORF type:complete len:376 (-),score=50.77 TRINITY_DN8883_c0_g1_i2:212-1186(-)
MSHYSFTELGKCPVYSEDLISWLILLKKFSFFPRHFFLKKSDERHNTKDYGVSAIILQVLAGYVSCYHVNYRLGLYYHEGWGGFCIDLNKAKELLNECLILLEGPVTAGETLARFDLGVMCDKGYGVEQSSAEAAKHYRFAADKGFAKAQYNLALMYRHGNGVPRNYVLSAKYYKMAADQGHSLSQNNYAILLLNGKGVAQDVLEAEKYFGMAALSGNLLAANNLAELYRKADKFPQNLISSIYYYKCARGYSHSDFWLNVMWEPVWREIWPLVSCVLCAKEDLYSTMVPVDVHLIVVDYLILFYISTLPAKMELGKAKLFECK